MTVNDVTAVCEIVVIVIHVHDNDIRCQCHRHLAIDTTNTDFCGMMT